MLFKNIVCRSDTRYRFSMCYLWYICSGVFHETVQYWPTLFFNLGKIMSPEVLIMFKDYKFNFSAIGISTIRLNLPCVMRNIDFYI